MQISSATTIPFIPVSVTSRTTSSSSPASASDQVVLNDSADTFSSFVNEARSYPEVRSQVVDSFKSRIQSGNYPSQDVISGLSRVLGGVVAQNSASQSAESEE